MDHFDPIDTVVDEREERLLVERGTWMCNERQAAGAIDNLECLAWGDLVLLLVGGFAVPDVLQKRFVIRSGQTFIHQCAGDVRPANGTFPCTFED